MFTCPFSIVRRISHPPNHKREGGRKVNLWQLEGILIAFISLLIINPPYVIMYIHPMQHYGRLLVGGIFYIATISV
jgi:hypothetical protein